MHVVATAGHVDHGKSTLVRALTGIEPDRWAEERRRGMTIDLGYAWTVLPSGQQLAFVDVPGHQRFIGNMLAGVGPVPAVLVVVAADEGWRRQSGEHLAAIDALGVAHGVLAVTRSDLADPAAATAEALDHIAASSLGHVEAVAVSGETGAGLDALRAALDRLVAGLPPPRLDGRLRLWVDRAFSIRGSGTVVTGTLGAGTLSVGDELVLASSGAPLRVRGMETLKDRVDQARPVARVALNLRGVGVAAVRRGDALLTPGVWRPTRELDVRLSGAEPADLPGSLILHVGSVGVPARTRPLGDDVARLSLAGPLPLEVGDRALLRDPGQQRVAAGVVVLDIDPPPLTRRGAAAARAHSLARMTGTPDPAAEVARRGAVRRGELLALGVPLPDAPPPGVRLVGDWLVSDERWEQWSREIGAAVDSHARDHPLESGLPLESARRLLALPDARLLDGIVASSGAVLAAGGRVRRPGAGPAFPPAVLAALETVRRQLAERPFAAPEQHQLDALALTPQILAAATSAGLLLRLSAGVFVLPGTEDEAVRRLAALPQPFTASEARQALETTRRVAIPLLEYLDGRRRTRRVNGVRREVLH